MILNDNKRTTISISNVCSCWKRATQDCDVIVIKFNNGEDALEYKETAIRDADMERIQEAIAEKDLGIKRSPCSDTGPR